MKIIKKIKRIKKEINAWHNQRQTIGLIPTMGNLHNGHLSLIKIAKKTCHRVIVSIFVNPTQFGPNEDYDAYPRTMKADRKQLSAMGVDILFTPENNEIYANGIPSKTVVTLPEMNQLLCGQARPGHFDGVATIVLKLLNIVEADVAVFGEKDYQQLLLIKQFVKDLNMNTNIVSGSIIRESDNLAMSSRNRYLNQQERQKAPILFETLNQIKSDLLSFPTLSYRKMEQQYTQRLTKDGFDVDYLTIADKTTLLPLDKNKNKGRIKGRILVAAKLGNTRLIDNLSLENEH